MSFVSNPLASTHQVKVLDMMLGGSKDHCLFLVADDMLQEVVEEGQLVLWVTLKEGHFKVFWEDMFCV